MVWRRDRPITVVCAKRLARTAALARPTQFQNITPPQNACAMHIRCLLRRGLTVATARTSIELYVAHALRTTSSMTSVHARKKACTHARAHVARFTRRSTSYICTRTRSPQLYFRLPRPLWPSLPSLASLLVFRSSIEGASLSSIVGR